MSKPNPTYTATVGLMYMAKYHMKMLRDIEASCVSLLRADENQACLISDEIFGMDSPNADRLLKKINASKNIKP